jgi:pilus assembly protein Flp/PilA
MSLPSRAFWGPKPASGWIAAERTGFQMNKNRQLLSFLWRDESGQDLIEYALVAMLIALVAITGLNGLASKISNYYTGIGTDM